MHNVHQDLDAIKDVALHYAKEHKVNYNIILMNPNEDGEFSYAKGSTYEFVTDSYFNKERPNVKKIITTDEMILAETVKKAVTDSDIKRVVQDSILYDEAEFRIPLPTMADPGMRWPQDFSQRRASHRPRQPLGPIK